MTKFLGNNAAEFRGHLSGFKCRQFYDDEVLIRFDAEFCA